LDESVRRGILEEEGRGEAGLCRLSMTVEYKKAEIQDQAKEA